MNAPIKRRAGQPIMVFLVLVLGWTAMRAVIWESPFVPDAPSGLAGLTPRALAPQTVIRRAPVMAAPISLPAGYPSASAAHEGWSSRAGGKIAPPEMVTIDRQFAAPQPGSAGYAAGSDLIASHQLLFMAAMGQVPVPADIAIAMRSAQPMAKASTPASRNALGRSANRWSMDGWLFLRPDAAFSANTGPRFASYGASQAGAVLRYRLRPQVIGGPAAHVRATRALAAGRESEIALGLSARPVRTVPIAAFAEMRATRGAAGTELRPAAFAVTEIAPVELPHGLRAEAYLAAGYVGGNFSTPFVDGQARLDRGLVQFDRGSIRGGVGAWGGAQKDAARLDFGPTASVNVKLGSVPARLAVDYRLRIAGDAEPGSGVAITLTTGF